MPDTSRYHLHCPIPADTTYIARYQPIYQPGGGAVGAFTGDRRIFVGVAPICQTSTGLLTLTQRQPAEADGQRVTAGCPDADDTA